MASYTVFDHGNTVSGNARSLLTHIRDQAAEHNPEIDAMTVEQYADAIIEDAPFFLDGDLLDALRTQHFDTNFDRALNYLTQMPTSGVRILTVQAA
jgi:hypothetical protein